MKRTIVAAPLAAAIAATACLGSIPDAAKCPPDALHPTCIGPASLGTPSGPATAPSGPSSAPTGGPGTPPAACTEILACLATRDCACAGTAECTKTSSTCFPAPDCPPSVTGAAPSARCLDTTAAAMPVPDPGNTSGACLCGCASCATTCDGQGPVIGPNQALVFTLTSAPSRGTLSAMLRARGTGSVTLVVVGPGGATPLGTLDLGASFAEARPGGSGPSWTTSASAPTAIELHIEPGSVVEVDCVVPFVR